MSGSNDYQLSRPRLHTHPKAPIRSPWLSHVSPAHHPHAAHFVTVSPSPDPTLPNLPLQGPPARSDSPFRCSSRPILLQHISQHPSVVSRALTSLSPTIHCWSPGSTKTGLYDLVLHVLSQALQDADAQSRKWVLMPRSKLAGLSPYGGAS